VLTDAERKSFDFSAVDVVTEWKTDDFETDFVWLLSNGGTSSEDACRVVLRSFDSLGCAAELPRRRTVEVQRVEFGALQRGSGEEYWFEGYPVKLSSAMRDGVTAGKRALEPVTVKAHRYAYFACGRVSVGLAAE
jgi:hypothetical protein